MKRHALLLLTALLLLALPVFAVCANPPVTSGSVGYQSHSRVISAIHPHPTQPYSLLVSWAYTTGAPGGTSTISFGANSGIVAKFGPDCETALGEKTPGTGDCWTVDGWTSQGPGDVIASINFPNGNAPGSGLLTVSRWFVNGAKILELWGTGTNSVQSWHWNDTGLTKIRSDNVGDTWLYLDGYENGVLVTKSLNFHCGP